MTAWPASQLASEPPLPFVRARMGEAAWGGGDPVALAWVR